MLLGVLKTLILIELFHLIDFMLVAMVYLESIFGHYLYLFLKRLAQNFKNNLMKGKLINFILHFRHLKKKEWMQCLDGGALITLKKLQRYHLLMDQNLKILLR